VGLARYWRTGTGSASGQRHHHRKGRISIVKINLNRAKRIKNAMNSHDAATAINQLLAASALKIRSVERETRLR